MKRYSVKIGNFETREEARALLDKLLKFWGAGWYPGQPSLCPDGCDKDDYARKQLKNLKKKVFRLN